MITRRVHPEGLVVDFLPQSGFYRVVYQERFLGCFPCMVEAVLAALEEVYRSEHGETRTA